MSQKDGTAVTLTDVISVSVPAVLGWVTAVLPRGVLAPLAFYRWLDEARGVAITISVVLVICAVGYCRIKSRCTVRKLALWITSGFILGLLGCATLRFLVDRVLVDGLVARDFVWPSVYGFTLVAMVMSVVFWSYYLATWRQR